MSVTIILAVAHALCRRGLRLLLEEQEAFHVMAEATKGLEAIQLIQALQPKIQIVDFMMSDLSALEITRRVRRHTPATRVVMLSVLYLAARGLTNREIAMALFISPRTVETHRAYLMRKLNLRAQTDLIRYALWCGIIAMES